MSGSTIGGFAGAAIGFMFGGPAGAQWGFMIGSAVGGYVDPQQIEGPRLTDGQTQTSSEGVPRSIVYGTDAVAGNVIQCGPLIEHKKKERAGKGGPETTTYTYTRTVAIRICEAAPLGGKMKLRRVWQDDKLVYDVSDSSVLNADSAKFASILTFYSGDEDQMPDPSLEALPADNGGGVGNVPAYRGTCYAVLTDLDCTDRQGAVSQFRWEVCSEATEQPVVDSGLEAGRLAKFINAHDPRADSPDAYTYRGSWTHGTGGGNTSPAYNTLDEVLDWAEAIVLSHGSFVANGETNFRPRHYIGYVGSSRGTGTPTYPTDQNTFDVTADQPDVDDLTSVQLLYQWYLPDDGSWLPVGYQSYNPSGNTKHGSKGGTIFTRQNRSTLPGGMALWNSVNFASGSGSMIVPLSIEVTPRVVIDSVPEGSIPIPDMAGYYLTPDYLVVAADEYAKTNGTFKVLTDGFSSGSDPSQKWEFKWQGPVLESSDPNYSNAAYWTAAYNAAVAAGTMPPGMTFHANGAGFAGTSYPQNQTFAFSRSESSAIYVTPGKVLLASIVLDLCDRVGIGSDQVDVSALAGMEVRGFSVSRQTTPHAAIRELMRINFFDFPEWGNSGETTSKLRAVLRGGPIRVMVSEDDVTTGIDNNEYTKPQPVEFPRKVSLTASDPDRNYEPATQPAEIDTENVKAVGEISISTALVLTRDENAVVVNRLLKVEVDNSSGRLTLELPDKFSQYTASDAISYQGRRLRIDKVERSGNTQRWELVRDSVGSTTSEATGSPTPPPTPPVPSTRGPTMFAALNLPRLRSGDTGPGMYVGVTGLLPGWVGCDLYVSVDGGITEQLVATFTEGATMGTLAANLAVAESPLSVALYDGELDSVTSEQLVSRQNAAAVTTNAVSEILQFQTAVQTGDNTYDLSDLLRGELGTTEAQHYVHDSFVLLDNAIQFVPLDINLAGRTLIFRPVSIGTAPANNATYSVLYLPKFTGAFVADPYVDDVGSVYVDENGSPYYSSEV